MFIFDHPYISDVAENYLVDSQSHLLANDFSMVHVSKEANHISEAAAVKLLEEQKFRWLYSNSENAIAWIVERLGCDSDLARKVDLFKNKFKFRQATADLFPDVKFFMIPADDIDILTFDMVGTPFIIKPVTGFISAGVYRVDNDAEWMKIRDRIKQETEDAGRAFPEEVLNSSHFIIESVIPGEEYAVDAYFDDDNRPVVMNIMHHRFSGSHDMSDRLYVTSPEIINRHLVGIEDFLRKIAGLGDFRGLPVHAEVRIDSENRIRPIEINPLRFAGWCATDIAYYSYGMNVYDYFENRRKPDWETLLADKKSETYAMAVIERPDDISGDQVFDYEKLAGEFGSVINLREIDYRKFSLFAFVFFRVSPESVHELETALNIKPEQFLKRRDV